MTIEVFYSRPGHLIRRLNQISVALFLEEMGHLDLTPRQYSALNMIGEVPNIDQGSLSDMIAMDKTTTVKVLDLLVEKGLITRTRSDTDRRTNRLHITDAGNALLKQIMPLIERSDQRILAPLNQNQQQRFMEMLTQLVHVNNIYSRAPMNAELSDGIAERTRSGAEKNRHTAGATRQKPVQARPKQVVQGTGRR